MKFRILLTGSGGMGGVNFVRALRFGAKSDRAKMFIAGTEFNKYYIQFPNLDVSFRTPRHSDPSFIPVIKELARKYKISFLHPNPSSEARVVAEHLSDFEEIGVRTFLPSAKAIAPDKEEMWNLMRSKNVRVPGTYFIQALESLDEGFKKMSSPLWLRTKQGAGARLSLKLNTAEEARYWIKLNVMQQRARATDFMLQEFLPGRDIAFDSLWYHGRMVASSARERLEYPFKHISLTGLTGTPSVARIIHDKSVNRLGIDSVKALEKSPNGFYSTDIKEDSEGRPAVTEVDGKWHTTASLWGYAFAKAKGDNSFNIAYTYLKLGLENPGKFKSSENLYPEGYKLIRQMDSGVLLQDGHTQKLWRIV